MVMGKCLETTAHMVVKELLSQQHSLGIQFNQGALGLESQTGGQLVSPATGSEKKSGTPYILSSECTFDCI